MNHEVSLGLRNEWEWLYCVRSPGNVYDSQRLYFVCLFVYRSISHYTLLHLLSSRARPQHYYIYNGPLKNEARSIIHEPTARS